MRRIHLAAIALGSLASAHCATTTRQAQPPVVVPIGARETPQTALALALAAMTPDALETARDRVTEHQGTLGERPRREPNAPFEHTYAILLERGETVQIDLHASYDTVLRVRAPSGQERENDDVSQGVLDSRLRFTADAAGVYRVVATSFAATSRGPFTLRVARGSAAGEERPTGAPADPRGATPLADHSDLASLIDSSAPQRTFRFEARRGDWLELETHHAAFDTVLELRGPRGESWQNDDRVSGDLHSRIAVVAPADGTYVAAVHGYRPTMQGAFKLRFDRLPRPTRGGGGEVRVAGPRGRGQIYGVFLGIRDYGTEANSLPHCDEDATELARVMRERGLMDQSRQVVLTNAQVTPAAARAAIQQMVARVEEDDVLLVFYSGHGRQIRGTTSATEPDGMDETIALRGGNITDDEMATLLTPARGTVLLALDSCYSGGFARDVIAGPRRIGLFASEEDVLSQVAQRFSAGGYLSYWLRTGLGGEADRNHDGLVLVGELTDYLLDRFAQYRGSISTTGNGDFSTQQQPRLERGSVEPASLLLRLAE
jgi:hypothetical protein